MPAQPAFRLWIGRLALIGATLALSTTAFAGSAVHPSQPVYPTDRCVARKLAAAADACQDLVLAESERSRDPREFDERVSEVTQDLANAWQKAETDSSAAGVDCVQTTVTSQEMETLLEDGAQGLAAALATASGKGRIHGEELHLLGAVAKACSGLILAESRHLLERFKERNTRELERERRRALHELEASFDKDDGTDASLKSLKAGVKALAEDAIDAAIVSPNVSTSWTMVSPDPQVPYLGQTLEPTCAGGTPWVYFVKRGTVNKLIVYYEGGGACWDYFTCAVFPTYAQTVGAKDDPSNATTGLFDYSNPESPFRDWNAVFVPYCTGDIHWGDNTVVYTAPNSPPVTIQHKGFVNAQVAEKFAREHFVDPDEVFVTGSSAGAYGSLLGSVYFQERVYPSARFATLGDAGNGIVTQDFQQNDFPKWGITATFPNWIPGWTAQTDPKELWTIPALFYPESRFANYATAYDGGLGGQTGFYNIMLNPGNVLAWLDWWHASCAWHDAMEQQTAAAAAAAPNYRYYIGTGSMHTMWGSNKVYTDTTGGVPLLVDWVTAMRDGTSAWTNVQCTNCGVLLPGDPRPTPAQPPFTPDDSSIVCPAAPGP
ncbi:MAG TPA: hypothetical protein DEP35_08035 [Deltaproteobacteria bacterium]|jgi:hypothetical protein|nr:hypothetical protein [Deltaproteobacteria bacterium]